jgi:hypothetical protein
VPRYITLLEAGGSDEPHILAKHAGCDITDPAFWRQGLDIFATGYPASVRVNCDTGSVVDDIETTETAGSSSLSYDSAAGQYKYVWKTEKSWSNTCRQLIVRFKDGTADRVVAFKFK